jgi:hypothetical protein
MLLYCPFSSNSCDFSAQILLINATLFSSLGVIEHLTTKFKTRLSTTGREGNLFNAGRTYLYGFGHADWLTSMASRSMGISWPLASLALVMLKAQSRRAMPRKTLRSATFRPGHMRLPEPTVGRAHGLVNAYLTWERRVRD